MINSTNLINFIPPSELSLNLIPTNVIQKRRVKQDTSSSSNQHSLRIHCNNLPAIIIINNLLTITFHIR
ncbi:hypothetical protein HanPSC8_Chr09g0350141 [Helianthus annuus]|nr:hypothetical protein HanPSC8_Chr09g0350141 [Helianthus annuus]